MARISAATRAVSVAVRSGVVVMALSLYRLSQYRKRQKKTRHAILTLSA